MPTDLIWTALGDPGYEHVRVDESHAERSLFDSMLVRVHEGIVRRGGYTLLCDKAWRTRELRITAEQAPGQMATRHLLATGDGRWTDADGAHLPELDGCIDVDIAWTPLTNTLPVRRLRLQPGQEDVIRVVYLALPGLTLSAMEQRYVGLGHGRVRYTSVTSGFTRDLAVDDAGFVVDYPGLFRRVWPTGG